MGAVFSGLAAQDSAINLPSKPNLGDLPESCIALVLSCLDPLDICKVARVTKTFRQASLSDSVWESKLPENHQILVRKLFGTDHDQLSKGLSKREIYARLSHSIRFAADTKEVWLDKGIGGICVAISWKGLKITGIDDRRYWTHITTHESRFQTIAYLRQIWWLEIEGNLEFEFPVGMYSLFFRLRLGRPSTGLTGRRHNIAEKIHGWNINPVKFQLESSNGQHEISQCFLEEHGKWLHHHAGDFIVDNSNIPTVLKFSMTQIDCTHTKGGLCLDSVLIFPSKECIK